MHPLFLPIVLLLLSATAQAQPTDEDRALFLRTYNAARSGDLGDVREQSRKLRDYPLYPYLEAADLDYRLRNRKGNVDARMAELLKAHPDLGVSDALRASWLQGLGKREQWRQLLEFYVATEDPELRCYQVTARIRLGRKEQLLDDARALWLAGKDQPDACDDVFEWMEKSGTLTPGLIEERMKLAMEAGQPSLARHLAKRLSDAQQARADAWYALYRNPVDRLRVISKSRDSAVDTTVLAYGVRKAARSDALAVSALFNNLMRQYSVDADTRRRLESYLAWQLALDRDPAAVTWYAGLDRAPDDATQREWRVRAAIYNGEWAKAKAWIEQMLPAEQADDRWRYWYARSLESLPEPASHTRAQAIFSELAAKRGFYPYLAADRVKRGYNLQHRVVVANADVRNRLAGSPAGVRAHELYALNLIPQARGEWRVLTANLPPAEMEQAAVMARDWEWHSQAIQTLALTGNWDDIELRYPILYKTAVLNAAREQSIDPAWIYSIMRTESLFIPDARSSANALGLLQLLPSTARRMGSRLGINASSEANIMVPGNNIRLGAAYLKDMLGRFNGQVHLASAAYNAGPERIAQWRPRQSLPADVWIENIPFNETRNYVVRVSENMVAFEWRLGRPLTPLSKRLTAVAPR